jgi:hypothetical protein
MCPAAKGGTPGGKGAGRPGEEDAGRSRRREEPTPGGADAEKPGEEDAGEEPTPGSDAGRR